MANIQPELNAIMQAVYGQQVRSSIHDAIEKINDVSEVVLTTGVQIDSPTSSSAGFYEDSLYLNTNTFELWKCTGLNSWVSLGIFKGPQGEPGTPGIDGENGNKWYRGTQVSAATLTAPIEANIGDNYLNITEGKIYHCTVGGNPSTWVYDMTLTGGGSGGASTLDELDDVVIAGATNGQGLVYEGGVWKNKNVASDVNVDGTTITKNGNVLTLSDSAKTSLGKADTAYQKPSTGIPQSDLATEINEKLSKLDSNGQIDYSNVKSTPTIPNVSDTYSATSSDAMSGKAVASALSSVVADTSIVAEKWVNSKAYTKGDIVQDNNKIYEAIQDNVPSGTATSDTTYWKESNSLADKLIEKTTNIVDYTDAIKATATEYCYKDVWWSLTVVKINNIVFVNGGFNLIAPTANTTYPLLSGFPKPKGGISISGKGNFYWNPDIEANMWIRDNGTCDIRCNPGIAAGNSLGYGINVTYITED